MSLLANIDHLAAANGIEAVCVVTTAGAHDTRGPDERWRELLHGAVRLFQMTAESSIRLVVGNHTMVVQRENDETVAVVLTTGHAIAKSLRRMIRRMAKKDRGPLRPEPMVTTSAPVVEGPATPPSGPPNPMPFSGNLG
ncbi:MAG: hypothetical protein V3V08_01035 [Nannocystaceae bacterium]